MDAGRAGPDPWGLGRYARVLRRRWAVVLVCALLGAALGGAYAAFSPASATASAMVNLNVISGDPFNLQREPSGLIDDQTEVQTARSSEVMTRAAQKLDGPTATELRDGLTAEVYPDATVLRLTYRAETVDDAVAGADRIAEEFLTYRGSLARQRVANAVDQLSERRDQLRDDVLAASREIAAAPPGSRQAIAAAQERDILNTEIEGLLLRIGELSAIETTGGTVITSAADTGATTGRAPALLVAAGLLAGLLLGLVAAFARDALDRRVRDEEDVALVGAGPVLARLPHDLRLPARGEEQDALLRVWQLLDAAGPGDATPTSTGPRVLAVLDATGRDDAEAGVPTLGAALTLAGGRGELVLMGLAQHRLRTLSVELHLEPDETGHGAGAPGSLPGGVVFRSTRHEGLRVRWFDPLGGEGAVLARLGDALTQRPAGAERTVVCLGPAAGSAGRMLAARLADAVLVATRTGRTRRAGLAALAADVDAVGGRLAGAVDLRGRARREREHVLERRGDQAGASAPPTAARPATDPAGDDVVRTR